MSICESWGAKQTCDANDAVVLQSKLLSG